MTSHPKTITGSLMGDPPPGRTPWSAPDQPQPIARPQRPVGVADVIAADLAQNSAGSPREHGVLSGGERSPAPPPAGTDDAAVSRQLILAAGGQPLDYAAIHSVVAEQFPKVMGALAASEAADHVPDVGEMAAETLRPVAPICAAGIEPGTPPTTEPLMEWMAPSDLLVDGAYQRDLSDKSVKLIHRIVEHWDWRRFKPPVVAWTEAGFEIIDGQHTAIAAATHPGINKIPVLVVEAADLKDRASAFIGHNRDRLNVSAVQMHQAAATAGDEAAVTVNQVCERAGVRIVTGAWGRYAWQAGETMAITAIGSLVSKRGAQRARMILQSLVSAGLAPITANEIKAADLLFSDRTYADEIETLPVGGEDLAQAVRALGAGAAKEIKEVATIRCMPTWKATAAVWFKKTRKRRRSA